MIITYSLALVAVFIGLCVFFSPAFAYTMQVVVDGKVINHVSLLNLAIDYSYATPVYDYEFNPVAATLLGLTIATIIIMGICILFIAFYKSKTGLKIKRNIASCAIAFTLCITNLVTCSALAASYGAQGKTIGLAFIFYFLAIIAAIGLLFGQIIAIVFKFLEKYNRERFDELIEIERSRIPYVSDPYKKELAIANLKYMECCNTAPKVTKQELEARRQSTLKLMLEHPILEHDCCGHDHQHEENTTCKIGSDK